MSKFVWEPEEVLWQEHELDDCECGRVKLKTRDLCPVCSIRQRLREES